MTANFKMRVIVSYFKENLNKCFSLILAVTPQNRY